VSDDASETRVDPVRFCSLYLARFAQGSGFVTLITLLPTYTNVLDPSATTVLGVTVGAGVVIGMHATGYTLAQTVAVVPLAWVGDRYDERTVLLVVLGIGAGVHALFPLVGSSLSFIAARALQGVIVTGLGLMSLALVGQIATPDTRANYTGRLSDGHGRAPFVFAGGTAYGLVAVLVPFAPTMGAVVGGVAASFGIRELVRRPGSVIAPVLGAG